MDARVDRFPPSSALRGPACAILLLILGGVSFARAGNVAEDLVLTIRLADLPEQVTLCRFPAAIQAFGVDQAWQVQIDADGDPSTGQSGIDLLIQVSTAARTLPCSPQSVSSLAALDVLQVRWDENDQAFVATAGAPTLELDFPGNALRITTSLQPDLPPISANSVIGAVSAAYYGNNANAVGTALDASPPVSPGASSADPVGDVADCNAECSPAATWYPLVDLVGLVAGSSAPPPIPPRAFRDGFEDSAARTVQDVQRGLVTGTVYLPDRVVTARSADGKHLWISDAELSNEYEGVYVFRGAGATVLGAEIAPGARVDVLGDAIEFDLSPPGNTLTEINNAAVVFAAAAQRAPLPLVFVIVPQLASLTAGEPHEGVLVQVRNVRVTSLASGNRVTVVDNDGNAIVLDDDAAFVGPLTIGTCYATITGVMHLNFFDDERRLLPRGAADLVAGNGCD